MDDLDLGATIKGFSPGQKVFGRYTLKKILGRGGMGVVWLGHDGELEREVALKFLPEIVALDPEALADLKRETRRNLDLTHPHIVRIYDFVSDSRTAAISMEYVNGASLSTLKLDKAARVFTTGEIRAWLGQLTEALTYAHTKAKVVHRDLKPANLMLTKDGELKITDFGIARGISDSVSRVSAQAAGSSGTPVYMSPQQMMGEKPAVTDDIYALGATLYELLTGKPPFYSGNVFMQVQSKLPPSIAERRQELEVTSDAVPDHWEQTIAACLAKEPADRPQSMAEIAQRLGLNGKAVTRLPPTMEKQAEPVVPVIVAEAKRTKSKTGLYAVLAVALAVVIAVALLPRGAGDGSVAREQPARKTTPPPGPAGLEPRTIPELDLVMLPIPAGSFRLGTPGGGETDERPVTAVTFTRPFWLGKTEVTQRQWRQVMGSNGSARQGDDLPVTNFTWFAAVEFCKKMTERERAAGRLPAGHVYSLPTEMQWEYAARAGSTADRMPGMDDIAWHAGNSGGMLHPVAQKRANAWGLHDMLGNASEMCLDDYGPYRGGQLTDPVTVIKGENIVLRGGCYQNDPGGCRPASRYPLPPVIQPIYGSFRLALIPESSRVESPPVPAVPNRPQPGQAWVIPDPALALVPVAAGTFTMGSTDDWFVENAGQGMPTMRPLTEVTITRPFWLGKTEVTQGQWRALMGTTVAQQREKHKTFAEHDDDRLAGQGDSHPMYFVAWEEAAEFCRKLTAQERAAGRLPAGYHYSLPTEAQWEYAGRAGTTADMPADQPAGDWVEQNSGKTTHPVGEKPSNAWGLHDMMGNVAELCLDQTSDLPGGKVEDLWLRSAESWMPHAVRGGSYGGSTFYGRYGYRGSDRGGWASSGVGFRVALVPVP